MEFWRGALTLILRLVRGGILVLVVDDVEIGIFFVDLDDPL